MTLSWLRKDILLSMESFPLNNIKNIHNRSHPCFRRPYHHDDAIKWKYFPCYWPFVNLPITDAFTKANDGEFWCFLRTGPEQIVEQRIETPVIWYAIALIMTSLLRPWWPRSTTLHGLIQSGTVITQSNPSITIHPQRMSFDDLTSARGNSRQGTCPFEICSRILMTSTERIKSI